MQTIEPLTPSSAIDRPTYLVFKKVPIDETVTARWNASAVSSSTPLPPSRAALFTRMSLMYPLTGSSSVTSPGAAIAVPPLRSIRAMHASIDSLDTSLTATFAPYLARARAMPLPMFGPQPVTSATLPSSETSTVIPPLRNRHHIGPPRADDLGVHAAPQSVHRTEVTSPGLGNVPTFPRHS